MSAYTQEQLNEILDKHREWLRDEDGGERADLSGANLSGADLSGADLFGADLSDADLFGADLSGANLSGANLSRVYLFGAYLSGAYLSGAYLSGADLFGADLSRADLSGANLSRADLSGANLSNAKGLTKLPQMCIPTINEYIKRNGMKDEGEWFYAYKGTREGRSPQRTGDEALEYRDGKPLEVPFGNSCPWTDCGHGINLSPTFNAAKKWGSTVKLVKVNKGDVLVIPVDGTKFRVKRCEVIGTAEE
jgi:hypothetical protein